MNRDIAMILESLVYRGLLISSATLSMYLGYRLLSVAPRIPKPMAQRRLPEAHDFEARSGKTTVKFKTSTPGLFFAFFGALIIVAQLIRPPELDFVEQTVKQPSAATTSTDSGNLQPRVTQPKITPRRAEGPRTDRTTTPTSAHSPVVRNRSGTAIRPQAATAPNHNTDSQELHDEAAVSERPSPSGTIDLAQAKLSEDPKDEVESKSAHFGDGWMRFSGGFAPGTTHGTFSHSEPLVRPRLEERRLHLMDEQHSHCFGNNTPASKPLYDERRLYEQRLYEDRPDSWRRF